MPHRVDHDARRSRLVEAAMRVVATDGFAAVSVRRVAAEAGHSPGSLRYFFPTQESLIEAALAHVTELAAERLVGRIVAFENADAGRVVDAACALIEELLPLDETRRAEWRIYGALSEPSVATSALARWRKAGWAGTRHQCRRVVRGLTGGGVNGAAARVADPPPDAEAILAAAERLAASPDDTVEQRAAGLHALIDGLGAQLVQFPDMVTERAARATVRRAVTDLARVLSPDL
ncbi:TetR/AcrR family transcriptional regulator [Marinactinospora thermotolerans]|uniref:Transcriptional regulator, TetR family n=2 Tax=Marinactinospora thermotolerans TaxID=531310 RepID=A0A1T4SLV9_9ACTN|nr:TetR family transcriptional regulator C-terminal domain-containing protein [Marinactinospora thermotolerans]AGL76719.1 TetR family transcriptional regulator [Marinactinospora thermotolerans]SKA29192.1 transcriptional regulator, TetR family [Marinactinospora thermotolerans DSM 45154]